MTRRTATSLLLQTAMLVALLAAAALMSGCAAPAVTVASLAADGASYAASGKSLSDHALSAATGDDCSMLGMLDDGVLCRDRVPAPEVAVAPGPPPLAEPPAPAPLPTPTDNSAATFLALGTYPDWEDADHAVVQGRFYNPLVVPIDGGDETANGAAYWVIAGHPLASADGKAPIAQAKTMGFADARTVTLCRATYRPGPCAGEGEMATNAGATAVQANAAAPSAGPDAAAAQSDGPTQGAAAQITTSQANAAPDAAAVANKENVADGTAAPATSARTLPAPVADDVPTPLIPRPAQLAQRPTSSDTDTLY